MLADEMTLGAKLLGLAALINSGRPAFDGCYRVVSVGATKAIEFFEGNPGPGQRPVKILPYRSGHIAKALMGGGEVISGEFTGCVMATFKEGANNYAGHIDTNKDTSKRADWDTQKSSGGVELLSEYDTTGKLQPEHGRAIILCVADGTNGSIAHKHVTKQRFEYGHSQAKGDPFVQKKFDTLYTVVSSAGF